MSSVSSFKPEDDSESEFDAGVLQGRWSGRHTRSASRAASIPVASSTSDTPSIEDIDLETDDTQTRYADLEARIQALDPGLLKDYSKFFEDEKGYFTFSKVDEDAEILSVSEHGAVVWTATEKEKFFNHLDRKGRNGIREIAAAIGTKSELEVMDYLNFLHEGLISHHLQGLQHDMVILNEVPAAVEVSESCRAELDKCADVLAMKEDWEQSMVNRKRYGNNWVIADPQARKLVKNDSNEPLRGSIHLAAAILNVPNWVNLSRKIYMKFGGRREEDDWMNIKQTDTETPSMSGEALMDFYALTLSITRRLIQSSIFLAMSRFRQLKQIGDEDLNPNIRTEDVEAAIDILNMKHTRGHFVFDAVRRNGLTVVDVRNEKGWKPRVLSYDEVDKVLNGADIDELHSENARFQSEQGDYDDSEDEDFEDEDEAAERHSQPSEPAQAEPEPAAALEAQAGADDADDEDDDGDEAQDQYQDQQQPAEPEPEPFREEPPLEQDIKPDEPDPEDSDFHPLSRRLSVQSFLSSGEEEQGSDAEEEHAERHDQESSRAAEMKLWALLRQPAPPGLRTPLFTKQQLKDDVRNRPVIMRKTRHELTGWRDLTLYHSEWEEYGSDAPNLVDELAENRRKRRRIEEEVMWETGDEEDEEDEDESQANDVSEDGDDGAEGPTFRSASVVNSEASDVDQMDVDEVGPRAPSAPSKSPSIAVELPEYEPAAWDTYMRSFSGSPAKRRE